VLIKKQLSLSSAIKEVKRRRKIQFEYNLKHGISPKAIQKKIQPWLFAEKEKQIETETANNLDFERATQIRDLIKKVGM